MLWGLSLSLCVIRILQGEVSEEEVAGIISNTVLSSPEKAFQAYNSPYWEEFDQEEVKKLLEKLWPKLEQPRMKGMGYHHLRGKVWLESDSHPTRMEEDELVFYMPSSGGHL